LNTAWVIDFICDVKLIYIFNDLFAFYFIKKDRSFDCFRPNGSEVTEIRYPSAFKSIQVFDNIDLEIIEGTDCNVGVREGSKLLKKIPTTVNDSVLIVKSNTACNFV